MALQNSFCLRQACPLNLFQNGGALGLPAIRRRPEVVMREVNVDGGDQFVDACKAAFADDVVGELAKEALNEVEPGGAGWSEVNVDARMFFQPGADGGMLVCGVVVDDEMQRELCGRLAMEFFEKGEPLNVRVLRCRRAEDPTIEVIERGKERHRAVARV